MPFVYGAEAIIVASPGGDLGAMVHLASTGTEYEDTFLVQQRAGGEVLLFDLATMGVSTFATYTGFDGSGQALTAPIGRDAAPENPDPPGYKYVYTPAPPELGGSMGDDIVELKALRIKPGDIAQIDLYPRDYLTGLELLSISTQEPQHGYRYVYRWDDPPSGPSQWLRTIAVIPEDGSTFNLSAPLTGGDPGPVNIAATQHNIWAVTAVGHAAGAGQLHSWVTGDEYLPAVGQSAYFITALSFFSVAAITGPQVVLFDTFHDGAVWRMERFHFDPLNPTALTTPIVNIEGQAITGVANTEGAVIPRYFCTVGDGHIYELLATDEFIPEPGAAGWKVGTIGLAVPA